jgi:uncharacterized protein (TIGR03067 family)
MNGQFTMSSQVSDNLLSNHLTLDAMKLLRRSVTIICLMAAFIANAGEQLTTKAKGIVNQPTNAELKLLQGKWEGTWEEGGVDDQPPVKSPEKITITITGNSLHYHRNTNFWFETTFTLPAGTDPKQLHATIKDSAGKHSLGKVVVAIFKVEDGILTLATDNGSEEALKVFEAAPNRYELRKVEPQKKMSASGLGEWSRVGTSHLPIHVQM